MKRTIKIFRRMIIVIIVLLLILGIPACVYMRLPKFGKAPSGERLERIRRSSNYKNGRFENTIATPTYAPGYSLSGELFKAVFKKFPRRKPVDAIPFVKTDLLHLAQDSNVLVWFGHSSCFIQLNGKRILVDPVFSGNASPIPGTTKSFKGSDRYTVADLPPIDYLLISHDHYDHLDYETVLALKNKTRMVICGLGVGADFEFWGYAKTQISEMDWHEKVVIDSSSAIYTEPARHKSGRGFNSNNTLWLSFVIKAPAFSIYISGDSGYGPHFAEIGRKYGPVDLAILENGQYDNAWHYVHSLPDEVLKAAHDLKAKRLFPYHSAKFSLARHPWDDPLVKITELNGKTGIPLVTPMIGEVVRLDDEKQQFRPWWTGIK